jgi:hypothetical protein
MGKAVCIDCSDSRGSSGNQNRGKIARHSVILLMMDIMIIFMIIIMYKIKGFWSRTHESEQGAGRAS